MTSFWCFIVNFEHISDFFLFLLLILNKEMLAGQMITDIIFVRVIGTT